MQLAWCRFRVTTIFVVLFQRQPVGVAHRTSDGHHVVFMCSCLQGRGPALVRHDLVRIPSLMRLKSPPPPTD